jgi:hypothetical protein
VVDVTDGVQPGTRVDEQLWQQFRNAVIERHGTWRGHGRNALETALRLYIADESEVSAVKINQRLGRIESELGIAEADGGADTFGADPHAHAPSRYDPETDGKPSANESTDKKVAYLAAQVGSNPETVPRAKLRDIVKDEYGFRKDTAKRYVGLLIDHFDLVDHPAADADVLVSRDRRRELLEAKADTELEGVAADV